MNPSPSPTKSPSRKISIRRQRHLPATQNPLTVTLTGTNDQPVIDVQIPDFQVQEDLDQAGPTTVAQSGQLLFSDLDTNDSHIVQDTLLNADWSGGALTPAQENALDLFVIDNDGNWSFNGDLDLDFLAVGESITLTYEITVSDGNGLPATQNPLTVTLTGTNDQPVIDVQIPDFQVQEDLDQAGPTTVAQSGQLTLFSDLDTNDSHIVQDTLLNADWSGGALTPAQENALDLFVIDNDGNWSFNGDLDLDFLAVGESITLTYEITVSDGNGLPATQNPLTVTLTGTNDQPVIDVQIPDFQVQEDLDQAGPTTVAQSGQLLFSTSIPTTHTSSRTLS